MPSQVAKPVKQKTPTAGGVKIGPKPASQTPVTPAIKTVKVVTLVAKVVKEKVTGVKRPASELQSAPSSKKVATGEVAGLKKKSVAARSYPAQGQGTKPAKAKQKGVEVKTPTDPEIEKREEFLRSLPDKLAPGASLILESVTDKFEREFKKLPVHNQLFSAAKAMSKVSKTATSSR